MAIVIFILACVVFLVVMNGIRSKMEQMESGANTNARELHAKIGRLEELLTLLTKIPHSGASFLKEKETSVPAPMPAPVSAPATPVAPPLSVVVEDDATVTGEVPENVSVCEEGYAPPFCADVAPPSVTPVFAKVAAPSEAAEPVVPAADFRAYGTEVLDSVDTSDSIKTSTELNPSIASIESTNKRGEAAQPSTPPLPRAFDEGAKSSLPPSRKTSAYDRVPPPMEYPPSAMEIAFKQALTKIWNWFVVGEEHRKAGVSAEYAIATTWLIRVGVLIIVLGVGFGLKLSIDRGYLPPEGRLALSFLTGAGFLFVGTRFMTKEWQALGQGLIGCAIAIFYFSFFAAYSMYVLISPEWAFVGMIFVTVGTAILATRFNALSIAVLGLVGGYLTPVMIVTPHPNYYALYFYLTLLAMGMTLISFKRQWPFLVLLSFVFNSIIFAVAASRATDKVDAGIVHEISHLCGFFVIYSTAIIAYTTRHRTAATPLEIIALFANALFTFGYGSWLIGWEDKKIPLSIFAFSIAAFYTAHIWGFLLSKRFDRAVVSAFIALVAIFLGIAVPLLFTGSVLTSVFALQALAFLWLGRRLGLQMFYAGSFIFYAVTLVLMFVQFVDRPFSDVTRDTYLSNLANHLGDFIIPTLSLFAAEWVLRRPAGDTKATEAINSTFHSVGVIALTLFFGAAVVYMTFELSTVLRIFVAAYQFAGITVLWALFALYLLLMRRRMPDVLFKTLAGFMVVALVVQWAIYGWTAFTAPSGGLFCLASQYEWGRAFPRLISTIACLFIVVKMWKVFTEKEVNKPRHLFFYTALGIAFVYLTFEAATFSNSYFAAASIPWAVSIIWGIFALGMLVGGLQFNYKALRALGLTLFVVTIAKIFFIDLAGSDMLYRLLVLVFLGVVLLLAALAYMRKREKFQNDTSK